MARSGAVWAGAAAALILATPAGAQPSLPEPRGSLLDGRSEDARSSPVLPGYEGFGGFRGGFGGFGGLGYLPGTAAATATQGPTRPWSITPSIGIELLGTDNVRSSSTDRRADLITTITPALAAAASTARLTGQFLYAPSARIYAETRGQNTINHRFSGQGLATLLEDRLFLDLRGFAGLQPTGGGFTSGGTPVTDRRNQVQNVNLQVSPYLVHRFGGLATAQVGYSYQYFSTEGSNAFLPGSTQPFFTSQETNAHQGYAVFRTGEDFGRLALESRTVGTVYESNGVLSGAHRLFTSVQARYSVTREIAVLVEGGYEDQRYGGTRPISIEGPVWSVGVRFTPSPDSVIIARYGRRNGFDSAFLNANFSLGGRTRAFATYSEQLGTSSLQAADLLSSATVDPLGNLVDSPSGTPVLDPFGSSLLATQSTLFRVKRATAGISQSWLRDTVTLTGLYDDRTPVTSAIGTVGFAQKGYILDLSWARSLTPNLTGVASVQYGRTESQDGGNGDTYSARLGLAQELAPGLFGSLQYLFRASTGLRASTGSSGLGFSSGDVIQNIVILGLRQVF